MIPPEASSATGVSEHHFSVRGVNVKLSLGCWMHAGRHHRIGDFMEKTNNGKEEPALSKLPKRMMLGMKGFKLERIYSSFSSVCVDMRESNKRITCKK